VDESGDLATVYRYRVIATGATTDSVPSNVDTGRIGAISAFPRLEAESADKIERAWASGGHVANFANRSYLRFYAIDFGAGASSVSFNIAVPYIVAGQQIEIRLDDPLTGPVVGVLTTVKSSDIKNFNGTQEGMNRAFQAIATYSVQSTSLSGISGVHELFIVGRQVTVMPVWIGTIAHIDWMEFKPVAAAAATAPASADTSTLAVRGKGDRTLELKRKVLLESEVAA
jgi:hypothetical protein